MSETPKSRYDLYRTAKSYEANGLFNEALDAYTKAIEVSADYAHAWFYKSRLHYNLHQYKEAKYCAEKTLELAPGWEKHVRTIIENCDCEMKS
ncbi:MAG: tetratricopeptide repeat protein [Candidatus Thorarchaeota archaeon]|nr:MAG: tetratricopeptide repeat protein [Candidatus Thorarchaeota archaeon]